MKKLFTKYSWLILVIWLAVITIVGILLGGCKEPTSKKTEFHTVVHIERNYRSNSIYPFEPIYNVTLDDSVKYTSRTYLHPGDTVTYIYYFYEK